MDGAPHLPSAGRAGTIFCFTVLRPIEKEVTDALVHLNASTYATGCDEFRFFSNVSVIPRLSQHPRCGPPQGLAQGGCVERAIKGSMDVKMASWGWYTALNTPIFVQVWGYVLDRGYHLQHAWTIKLDVNVVWRPERLRSYLATPKIANLLNDGVTPLWGLNDFRPFSWPDALTGQWHLIGGIEILSRGAMQRYAEHRSLCEGRIASTYPTEDDYIEYCMRGVGATPVHMPLLLRHGWSHTDEVACVSCFVGYKEFSPPKDWARCDAQLAKAHVHYVDPAHCSINGELVINYGFLWQEVSDLIILLVAIGLSLIVVLVVFCANRRRRRRAEATMAAMAWMAKSTPPDERTALYPYQKRNAGRC